MFKNISNFEQIIKDYQNLTNDLDSNCISNQSTKLANVYFNFTKSLELAFSIKDFSKLKNNWLEFEPHFNQKHFNMMSLSLEIGDMDYLIKKSYLSFLLKCQQSIAQLLFDVFVYDLEFHNQHKEDLPPCIFFVNWFENPYVHLNKYFEHFTQSHFNSLAFYNNLPQLEFFINALFLRSKLEIDMNTFDPEYLHFHIDNLQKVLIKNFYVDIILKNNSIHLPEQFLDYIDFVINKFLKNPQKKQSTLEANELNKFLKFYAKQKLEFLFPNKNINTKTIKI